MNRCYQDKRPCPCTFSCLFHGKCCACVAHHRQSGGIPGCFFSPEAESTHDRSVEHLLKDRGLLPSKSAESEVEFP